MKLGYALLGVWLGAAFQAPALSQAPEAGQSASEGAGSADSDPNRTIVVTGERLRGSVTGSIPPLRELDAEDIEALGAGNIASLVDALGPQTSTGGQSGAQPIILLNGARISGFAEISGLPAEAVERIDILPEQVAVDYGYPPTSRVLNIVLKERFRAATGEAEAGSATAGGRSSQRADLNLASIGPRRRISLDLSARRDTELLESERDLVSVPPGRPFDKAGNLTSAAGPGAEIDPALSLLAGAPVTVAGVPASAAAAPAFLADFAAGANRPNATDIRPFRSLLPGSRQFAIGASVTGTPVRRISATLSGRFAGSESESRLGLSPLTLLIPAGNPFSPFGSDVLLHRYAGGTPLERRVATASQRLGLLLSGDVGIWRWTADAAFDRFESRTRTSAGFDPAALQGRVSMGDPTANPFGSLMNIATAGGFERARFASESLRFEFLASGPLHDLPAGQLLGSLRARVEKIGFESSAGGPAGRFGRDIGTLEGNLDLPVASRRTGTLSAIGDLSLGASFTLRRLSDFGTLTTTALSVRASPIERLTLIASVTNDEGAPGIQDLGAPSVTTPNVPNYDFLTGETYDVTRIDGGNPGLTRNRRYEEKLEIGYRPFRKTDFLVSANYARVRLHDPVTLFPVVTPAIEAAFPGRYPRDPQGRLLLIDNRPLNVAGSRFEGLRWGFDLSGPQGRGGPDVLRFNLSAHHDWRFTNVIALGGGRPDLDLLNGAAASSRGGQPRHSVDVQAGLFRRGLGVRLEAGWQAATVIRGGAGDLFFDARPRFNLRMFANVGEQGGIGARLPWLRTARLSLSVDNLFDSRLKVRNGAGVVPLSYQPAYLDPIGRAVRLSFRTSIS